MDLEIDGEEEGWIKKLEEKEQKKSSSKTGQGYYLVNWKHKTRWSG